MPGSDPYSHAIRQAAHDAVRVLVLAEADSGEGLDALRDVVSWLARCYGPDAIGDLAEELAADLVDALQVLAAAKGLTPPEMLDDWFRPEPSRELPPAVPTTPLPISPPPSTPLPIMPLPIVPLPAAVLAPRRPRSRLRPRSRWW